MKRNFTYIILSITLSLFFALPTFGQDYAYSWLSQLKGSSDLYVQDVETDAGFVYVTGYFTGTVDFNPTGTANTLTAVGTDGFIARYSKDNGALSYAKIITSASTVQVWDIEINGTYMYVTGNFAGTTDFNTHPSGTYNLTSYGTTPGSSTDAFIVRYRASDCAIYWAKQIGGTSSDYAKGIAVDASDNIYVTGYFYGTADFDPTTALQERTSAGGSDIFYAKYNSSGAYQWAQGAGDTGYQYAEDIELAGSYIYLSGYYAGTTSFYAGLNCSFICLPTYKSVTSLGGYDGFVAKISTGGLASSAFSIGGTSNDYIFDLALDAGSNIFIAGYHYGTTDFNPSTSTYNQTSSGYTDAFVAKYSNTGTFSWVKRVYGAGYNYAYKVEIDNSNYVNVAGVFSNTAYFYSGSYSSIGSGYDGYLLKLNNSGTYLKHFAVGGSGTDYGKALSTDGQDIYLGGYFASTDGDFDPWTTTDGNFSRQASYDGYIARYTALDAQPSSIPTNMTFSNITTSQIQVSYTAATGPPDGYLIVGRKNYWPATAPVDGRTYTAGSTLGQSVVVYSGAATTGTMTGLDPAGVYAFKVYAYNGSGFTTNYTTSSLSAYEYTLATEPTASPSTPTFANVNSTSFDLSFSAAAGPPTGYLVLRAEGAWPDTAPTDKEYYTVGQGLGNAVVANIGSSNSSLAQSGLTPGSDYYFKIYSYNGNSSTINYRTTSPLTATQNTLVSEPDAQATGISFSGAASNSIGTINFSTASGSPDGYIVVRKASGAAAWQPADGNTYTLNSTQGDGVIVHVGAGASFSDSYSMLANTEYFYTVYSYNGSGVYTNYYLNTPLTGSVFTLSTEPGAQPTVLNLSLAAPPDNISVINGSFTAASGPPTGYIVLRNVDAYPTSLPVDGTEYLAGESFGDATVAYVGTGTSFSNIDLAEATNYRYRVYSYNSNVASSTTINYKTDVPLEDNLSTEGSIVAPTAAPTSMVFSDVTSSSLTVSFTDASPTPGGYIAIRGAGFDPTSAPQDGTVYTNEVLASGTVAYVGSATTFVDDALAAGTEYTYRIYSYNGSGAGILYFTGTGNYLANSKTTFAIEPATQPTSLNFSTDPVLTDFLGLSFTETTPSSYLILRKTGGYPVDQPVDGEAYTGDADVFYTQSGLSKNETGLVPGTNYFYVIYAYSGSGVTLNYNTTAPLQGNHYLLAVEPDGQPSALAFSNTTTLGFDVNYSLATGVPDGYLGIIKENSAPTGVPADGTSYSAGAPIGDGTVVFSSNVKPVTLSGGSPGVEYFLHIYSYNGSGGGTKYRTTDLPLSGSHFTFATEPTEPAVVGAFTDITATTMTLNLTHPSDKPDGYLVIRKEASPPGGTPVDGQEYIAGTDLIGGDPVIYVGTQEIVSIANDLLNDGSTYHYAIFSYNGSGQSINYLSASPATGSETTLPVTAPTAVAASLVFTNVTSNSLSIDFDSGTPLPEGYIVLRKAGTSTTTPSNFTTYTLGETVVDTEVAYVGDLSGVSVAFDDTGLTPDNTYYYYVFAYNGESTATKYNSTSQSGSVALFADEPLSQPSDLVFSGITSTTIDATFTKSDATNYLVIRSEGTSPTTLPVDGTTYTPGVILDASNATTVVSVGTGNVANATSLTLSTQYFYSVYAYNGTGASTNYLLDGALSGDAWTLAAEPATQASGLIVSSVDPSSSSLKLDYTSTGDGVIILMKEGAAVTGTPVDGTDYAPGELIGADLVVYKGADPNYTATGLTPSTTYHYSVFSYAGTSGATNYKVTTPPTASATTFATEPTAQPSGITFAGVTSGGYTVTYVASGSAEQYLVLRNPSTAPTGVPVDGATYAQGDFISGNEIVYLGAATTFDETGLNAGTTYHYAIYALNGAGISTNYLLTNPLAGNTTTLAAEPTAQPTALVFSNLTTSTISLAFTNTAEGSVIVRSSAQSPTWAPTDGVSYKAGDAFGTEVVMYVGNLATYNDVGLTASTTYYYAIYAYNGSGATINYRTTSPTAGNKTTYAAQPGAQPTALTFSNRTTSTLTVSYTGSGAEQYLVLRNSIGAVAGTPVDGASYATGGTIGSDDIVYVGAATTFDETALTAGTLYYYAVYAFNGTGGTENYNVTSPLAGSGWTMYDEPANPPSNWSFTATESSVTPTWTGTGSYLILRSTAASPTGAPVDGAVYAAGDVIGDYVVVYSGDAWGGLDTGLQDNTTYQYAVYAYQGDAASPETVNYNATPLTATATTLQIDNTPPVLSANNTPTLVETGTDILVDVTIEDAETGVKSVTMDYRAVESGAAYTTENMLPDGSGNYTFTIPSTSLGTLGLEYKIQAFNNAQGQATFGPYSVAVKVTNETIPYNSGGTNVSNYRIIAVPLSLTSKSVKEVFKDLPVYDAANPSEWRLFHYSGGNTKEISTGGNIELGKGYWFISKENVDISTGAGSYAAVNSGSPYVMSLSAGWNQIGNPYPFKISWSKILEQNGLTGLDLKVFVGTGYAPATILDAYQGGFVLASSAFNLNISPDKTLIGGREEDEVIPVKNPLDQNHWELTLQLTDGKIANRLSGIGMHPEAMYAYDDYDDVNLPRFIKYLDVEHETNVMGYALSKDIVPTSGHHIWEFSVLSNTEDEHISITWENSYFGTNDKELVLWDLEANKTVDMRVSNTYTFRKSATNRFKVLFGNNRFVRENLLPDAPVVLQAYPNPFNDKVSITYALPDQLQQGTINVEVYNATGTKVKTIYTGSYRSGMQQVEWDGRDDHGSRLAGGMYLIRLSTGEKSGYHRIVLR